jgi:hypothetical protein
MNAKLNENGGVRLTENEKRLVFLVDFLKLDQFLE